MLEENTIVSLFDYSGRWPAFFEAAGYHIIKVDLKHGQDILTWLPDIQKCYGVLMAPDCTHFSGSGAQYWPVKDMDGRTEYAVSMVMAALKIRDMLDPEFDMLENPVGRLPRWIGQPAGYYDPCDYANYDPRPDDSRFTKKTGFWGNYKLPVKQRVHPIRYSTQGSWLQLLGGKSARTKELRSMTALAFSGATYEANRKPTDPPHHELREIVAAKYPSIQDLLKQKGKTT